jgi:ABC-type multidrug transport system permease subunit
MNRINSIYIATLLLCVNSLNTVLKVTEMERNMFYRHREALMYDSRAAIRAFTFAEIPFIFLSATVFVMLFYWIMVSIAPKGYNGVSSFRTRTSNILLLVGAVEHRAFGMLHSRVLVDCTVRL